VLQQIKLEVWNEEKSPAATSGLLLDTREKRKKRVTVKTKLNQ